MRIGNLATLGKVWGYLKYHHPHVTLGRLHWDYELFRVLPAVLDAKDRAAANAALLHWIENLGLIAPRKPCAKLDESDLDLRPNLDWLANKALLGEELSHGLQSIRDNRVPGRQFYISTVPNIGNPSFNHELGYQRLKFPDAGFQLLGLYRFWNIVEYWSPNREITGQDWNSVLTEFIPRVALAKTPEAYQLELMALIASMHDGHAGLSSALPVGPPAGKCQLPVTVRFIENLPVITGFSSADGQPSVAGLKIGDVVTELDAVPLAKLVENWEPYYAASNQAARLREIGRTMTRGECGESSIGARRDNQQLNFKVNRVPSAGGDSSGFTHDLPGPAFRLLSDDVAYLRLSSVKAADAAHYIEQASGTKGLIVDIRNYPSELWFLRWDLSSSITKPRSRASPYALCPIPAPSTGRSPCH